MHRIPGRIFQTGRHFLWTHLPAGTKNAWYSDVQEYKMPFPVWLDPQGMALEIFHNWDLPSFYVIDRDGCIRLSWMGGINQRTLEQYGTPLLEDKK
jgi:hypothetical protein